MCHADQFIDQGSRPALEVQYDMTDHMPNYDEKKQLLDEGCQTVQEKDTSCDTSNIHLCFVPHQNCFKVVHSKWEYMKTFPGLVTTRKNWKCDKMAAERLAYVFNFSLLSQLVVLLFFFLFFLLENFLKVTRDWLQIMLVSIKMPDIFKVQLKRKIYPAIMVAW